MFLAQEAVRAAAPIGTMSGITPMKPQAQTIAVNGQARPLMTALQSVYVGAQLADQALKTVHAGSEMAGVAASAAHAGGLRATTVISTKTQSAINRVRAHLGFQSYPVSQDALAFAREIKTILDSNQRIVVIVDPQKSGNEVAAKASIFAGPNTTYVGVGKHLAPTPVKNPLDRVSFCQTDWFRAVTHIYDEGARVNEIHFGPTISGSFTPDGDQRPSFFTNNHPVFGRFDNEFKRLYDTLTPGGELTFKTRDIDTGSELIRALEKVLDVKAKLSVREGMGGRKCLVTVTKA